MSVTELKSTPSASTTAIRNSTQASTSNKNRDGRKYRNNGKRWFQKQNAGGEEREAGSVGDCWACGSSLEYTGDGVTGIECRDCQMPN